MDKIKWFIYKITHPFVRVYWRVFKPLTSGAKAIVLHKQSILLTRNISAKYWSLPGGKVDKDETPEECLIRELREELALDIPRTDYKLGEYTSNKEGKRDSVHVFIVSLKSAVYNKQWELQDASWFSLYSLPDNMSPAVLRRIREFQNGDRNLISVEW